MNGCDFNQWFEHLTHHSPHDWQRQLGEDAICRHRLIRIPTGFGKTAGTALTWLFHRVFSKKKSWPNRLVFCLPMRVLVEQTEGALQQWIARAELSEKVNVHVLLGGHTDREWALTPEKPAIIVGTQDMLLSRAMNRGYSAHRAWWPIDFGLLNTDALWVFDEIQLMDVGLATSAQLAAFRDQDEARQAIARPFACWWMSATLQPQWLERAIDFRGTAKELPCLEIPKAARDGGLWAVTKTLELRDDLALNVVESRKKKSADAGEDGKSAEDGEEAAAKAKKEAQAADKSAQKDVEAAAGLAKEILQRHESGTLTLVVVNTVRKAKALFEALRPKEPKEGKGGKGNRQQALLKASGDSSSRPEIVLLHSRFRGRERARLADKLTEARPPEGRIIVATQVVEAGVDLSARVLFSELAPWPSLVQRFGRAARYAGESGKVVVFGQVPDSDDKARPYTAAECRAAHEALEELKKRADCSPRALQDFEEGLGETTRARLYPYEPRQILRRKDLESLFDTAPDLSGSDLDISRYIRAGDERDVRVFWRELSQDAREGTHGIAAKDIGDISRDELCPVPLGELRDCLTSKKRQAWRLDCQDKTWEKVQARDIFPGMTVLLAAAEGGYSKDVGWDAGARDPVGDLSLERSAVPRADRVKSEVWQTIDEHTAAVAEDVDEMLGELGAPDCLRRVLRLAARFHDWGKSHAAFQAKISDEAREAAGRQGQNDLAKAPDELRVAGQEKPISVWRKDWPDRRGFRHELASALGILQLLRRVAPAHEALTDPALEWLGSIDDAFARQTAETDAQTLAHPIARELASLSAREVNLLAFLVCAHHGKVRCAIAASADDQEQMSTTLRLHGVQRGDALPSIALGGATLPAIELDLAPASLGLSVEFGESWTGRVLDLRKTFGPFGLAFLEALLRAADIRVSRRDTPQG